jgi:hypothetical protein
MDPDNEEKPMLTNEERLRIKKEEEEKIEK